MYKQRAVDLVAIAGLFLLGILFLGDVLFPEEGLILQGGDISGLFSPMMTFAFEGFENGRLPLWNPHLFLGFPQYAEPQLSTFYPLMWLFSGLGVATAVSWLYAVHFGLTAVGGYLLIRQLKGSWAGGLLTGIILAFSAFMVAHLYAGHLPHIMTIAYLPLLLAAFVWAVKPRPFLRMIAATLMAAVPLALAILAGYAPFFPFLVAALSLLMIWLAWQAWQESGWRTAVRIIGQWILLGLFAGMLTAVQLLPTIEFALLSTRAANANYAFANSYAMPYWNLLTMLMPDLFGASIGNVPYWANVPESYYWEFAFYVGVLPLLLFALTWPLGKRPWRFWVVVGLMALVLALGASGGLHRLLYQLIPGFRLFRVPARMAYFFVFAAALLSGLMFERWLTLSEDSALLWKERFKRILIGGVVMILFLIGLSVLWQARQPDSEALARVSGVTDQLVRFGVLLMASLGWLIWGHGRVRWQVALVAVLILLVDFWGHGNKFINLTSAEAELGWVMADLALPPERESYRILTSGLSRNAGLPYDFYHADGYDDFRTEMGKNLVELANHDERMTSLLGVRYKLYGPDRDDVPDTADWDLLTQPAGVTIYERQAALPKAWVVHQVLPAVSEQEALRLLGQPQHDWAQTAVVQVLPNTNCQIEAGDPAAASVQVMAYEPERVMLQTDTAVAGWLVLNDLYYPGWRAFVDGDETTIQPTDYGIRGICLPAGQHEVVFQFQPQILRLGVFISGTALMLLAIAVLVFIIVSMRQRKINGRNSANPGI